VSADTIELGRYAEIAAHLARFPASSHAEIVARFGLSWAAWEAVSASWAAARDAELAAGGGAVSSGFVRAFVAVADRLQAQRIPVDAIGPLPPGFRAELVPAPPAPLLARTDGEPPVVEVARIPAGAEDLGASPFGGGSARSPFAATAAVSAPAAPVMPFAAATPGALDRALAHADALQGPRAPAVGGGSTVLAPEPAVAPVGVGELTMEQYTSLRVELQFLPDRAPAILARYGIRPEGREALFTRWRLRFEADPPLRMWFARGYAQYLAWLRENPGALDAVTKPAPG
jgi:hypothetical protein